MTITQTPSRPPDQGRPESRQERPPPVEPPQSTATSFWIGSAAGLGLVALTIAVVALFVALSNTGSGTKASTAVATGPAAPAVNPSPAAPPAFAASIVPLTLSEFKVTVPASVFTAGEKTLQITNNGVMQHEILVFHPDASIDPSNLPLGSEGNINEDAPGVNKISDGDNIDPGKSQTRQLDLSQPGTYVFVCNLPGHYKMGMWTKITVR